MRFIAAKIDKHGRNIPRNIMRNANNARTIRYITVRTALASRASLLSVFACVGQQKRPRRSALFRCGLPSTNDGGRWTTAKRSRSCTTTTTAR